MIEQLPDEKAIFLNALEKPTFEEQRAYLEGVCEGNTTLLTRVLILLKAHHDSLGPLDSPRPDFQPTDISPVTEQPGDTIGPYKLLQQLGEGGMGVVYMAEQTHPVERRVALKIIKPGMDTRQVIARFEAERQALAMMDHVNIARVLDAGATQAGRPYFVMELVHGVPITQYCDDNHLTPRQRLELFVPVCQAIQHAHQKGIIHRDIKPSNVMVSIDALEKSCQLQKGGTGDARQWIVLALAHARLAAQDGLPEQEREYLLSEARRWFDQADMDIDKQYRVRPDGDVLGQAIWDFREEARELMKKEV